MSPDTWTSGLDAQSSTAAAAPQPIAEVHVLLHGYGPGQAEVRITFPDDAKPGARNAAHNQTECIRAAIREITSAAALLGGA
jgi:hypothetical protein